VTATPEELRRVQTLITEECEAVRAMLLRKHADYGSSFSAPLGVFSRCSPEEAINVRLDDKLKRLRTGRLEIAEDTEQDIVGYLILKRVLRRMAAGRDGWDAAREAMFEAHERRGGEEP